jgi:LysM repeat protein
VLETASVTEAQRKAEAGFHGWSYHRGTAGIAVGDFADWNPEQLGDDNDRHVSCVVDIEAGRIKSIGAGGPTGKVAYQPRNGGYNPAGYFQGYFRAPDAPAVAPAAVPAPKPAVQAVSSSSSRRTYTVKPGDQLGRIAKAHGTTVAAIMRANPAAGRTQDFHIQNANLILAGQRIYLP